MDDLEIETLELHLRAPCKKCAGSGLARRPVWEAFGQAFGHMPDGTGPRDWTGDQRQWWADSGYGSDLKGLPTSNMKCRECSGEGHYEKWIPVLEFLEVLGLVKAGAKSTKGTGR